HFPGTVALNGDMQMRLLQAVCEEIRRNGFDKIILANGHGGNNHFINYFAQTMLDDRKDYIVYTYNLWEITPAQMQQLDDTYGKLEEYGHADHIETSEIMAI